MPNHSFCCFASLQTRRRIPPNFLSFRTKRIRIGNKTINHCLILVNHTMILKNQTMIYKNQTMILRIIAYASGKERKCGQERRTVRVKKKDCAGKKERLREGGGSEGWRVWGIIRMDAGSKFRGGGAYILWGRECVSACFLAEKFVGMEKERYLCSDFAKEQGLCRRRRTRQRDEPNTLLY